MQRRAVLTLDELKQVEDSIKSTEKEYEALCSELQKAKLREEGLLKVLGSTIKDTFQKNLGASLMKPSASKQSLPSYNVKSPIR